MPIFHSPQEVIDYLFPDTLETIEGQLFVLMKTFMHSKGDDYKKHKGLLALGNPFEERAKPMDMHLMTPKGWMGSQTYVFLFLLFRKLGIKGRAAFYRDIYEQYGQFREPYSPAIAPLVEEFLSEPDPSVIFEDARYWGLPPEILEYIQVENAYSSIEDRKKLQEEIDSVLDLFISEQVSNDYDLLLHAQQRNLVLNRLADFHSLIEGPFTVNEKHFKKYPKVSFIFSIALLWRLEYLRIFNFGRDSEKVEYDERGHYAGQVENPWFDVSTTGKMEELFDGLFEIKMLILDKVFDEEYKKLQIIRKNGSLHLLEIEKEVAAEGTRFIDLQKKYPYSDIRAKNYKGKIQKYEITEKIRIDL